MIAQNNVTHIVVGKDVAILNAASRDTIAVGQIGVFKNGSQLATTSALSAGDIFTVSYKDVTGKIVNTPHVPYSNIYAKSATNYVAPAQKKVYVGYNGTTGSISVKNSENYILRVVLKDNTKAFFEHPLYEYATFESDSDATQKEIAEGILASAIKNFTSVKPNKVTVVQPGMIVSTAVDTNNGFVGNATVVKDTNSFTVLSSGQYNTDKDLAVGDYVRIGAVGLGTAVTSEVYKVIGISGTTTKTVLVDRPIKEASGTYAAATSDIEVLPVAGHAAANYGISLTGVALPFEAGIYKYQVLDFEAILNEGFGASLVTVATAATKGVGSYNEVAELEWFLKGNRGEAYRTADWPVNKPLNAIAGKTYDVIVLNYFQNENQGIDRKIAQNGTILIVTEDESSATAFTSLKTVFGL